jgi:hypothetical protein
MSFLKIPTTLMRGVGRKILALFLLAGILPMAITASLAYFEVQRSMEDEVGRSLTTSALGARTSTWRWARRQTGSS